MEGLYLVLGVLGLGLVLKLLGGRASPTTDLLKEIAKKRSEDQREAYRKEFDRAKKEIEDAKVNYSNAKRDALNEPTDGDSLL